MMEGQRQRRASLLLLVAAVAGISVLLARSSPVRLLDLRAYDAVMRRFPLDHGSPRVMMVMIDDRSRSALPDPLVMWDGYYAEVLRATASGHAKAVALDTVFALPDQKAPAGRQQLAQAILENTANGSPVILGIDSSAPTPDSSLYQVAVATGAVGSLNLTADEDETVRRVVLCSRSGSQSVFSIGMQLAAMAQSKTPTCTLDLGRRGSAIDTAEGTLIPFLGPTYTVPHVSFIQVLDLARKNDGTALQALFKDKVVLIGPDNIQDRHATPLGQGKARQPGVEIHANVAEMVLNEDPVREADPRGVLALIVIGVLLSCALTLRLPWIPAATTSFLLVLVLMAATVTAWKARVWLPPVAPLAAVVIGYAGATLYRYRSEVRSKRQLRRHFSQYVPAAVVEQLLTSGSLRLEGRRMQVAVMFSDIRSFTTMTEEAIPEELVSQLNEYLSAMTEVITDHSGMVDKFIGDGILAVFGAPLPDPDSAWNAVRAAHTMLARLEGLNRTWSAAGRKRFEIGIGVHFGEVIVGNIGSSRKMEYTVIGDTVNTASRIESQTKEAIEKHGIRVLISGAVLAELTGRGHAVEVELMGDQILKGKKRSTPVYLLRGLAANAAAPANPKTMVAP